MAGEPAPPAGQERVGGRAVAGLDRCQPVGAAGQEQAGWAVGPGGEAGGGTGLAELRAGQSTHKSQKFTNYSTVYFFIQKLTHNSKFIHNSKVPKKFKSSSIIVDKILMVLS